MDQHKREIVGVTIDQKFEKLSRNVKTKRKVVLIVSRIHPGETPSSFVSQGIIEFLLTGHPVAKILRNYVTFVFIPMVNVDGVFFGNYRTSLLGKDLNRCWKETSVYAYPGLQAIKNAIENITTSKDKDLDLMLDLHADVNILGVGFIGNKYEDVYRFHKHTLFPRHLSMHDDACSLTNTFYNKSADKSGTFRRYYSTTLKGKVDVYSIELSYHSYERKSKSGKNIVIPYSQDEYLRLGENFCHALLDYYCTSRYITNDVLTPQLRELFPKIRKGKKTATRVNNTQRILKNVESPYMQSVGATKSSIRTRGKTVETSNTSIEREANKKKVHFE